MVPHAMATIACRVRMGGLVMGITVLPRGAPPPAVAGPADRRETAAAAGAPARSLLWRRAGLWDSCSRGSAGAGPRFPVLVPGPLLTLRRGEPAEITVVNQSDAMTAVHWHGIELQSYFDGVGGVPTASARSSRPSSCRSSSASIVDPAAGGIPGYFRAAASSTVEAMLDLSVRNRTVTQEYGHYLLVLGIIWWATGQFAAYATLAHRRPLGAVFVTGLVLLTNMSITVRDQLPFLVVFSLAALSLLVRLHADEERLSWLHRRIGDPAAVTRLYLRGGAVFVALAVAGSLCS